MMVSQIFSEELDEMRMQTFMMKELFSIIEGLPRPDLVTRELGTQAYKFLQQALMQIDNGTMLIFNFSDVFVMDSSFAGPSLLRLMRELVEDSYGERYIALSEATPSTEENITLTIQGHNLKLVLPVKEHNSIERLLGQIEPSLTNTFEMISQRKSMTARELADLESIGISGASNRLKRLYNLHLVTRIEEVTEEGRQHKYQSLMV